MSNLLILGASADQVPIYLEARRLGCHTIGVDQRADAPAATLADQYLAVSTREPEAIIEQLGATDVAGVIAPASDVNQPASQILGEHYRTPFRLSPAALAASTDKGYFRKVVERLGLPAYDYVQDSCPRRILAAGQRLRHPLVVKPSDSSGSKGITVVDDHAALGGAIEEACASSNAGTVIVEEAVAGRHGSAECVIDRGRLAFVAISERSVRPPHLVTVCHRVPARFETAIRARLEGMIEAVCRALEIERGPVNFDFVVGPDGEVYLVEMGARPGGNGTPRLVFEAFGANIAQAAIRIAMGERFEVRSRWRRAAALYLLHAELDGELAAVHGVRALAGLPELVDYQLYATVGQPVLAYTRAANKLGYLLLAGESRGQVERALAAARRALRLRVRTPDGCEAAA
jgi:biotin carboxylase